jgi:hypothetical protein
MVYKEKISEASPEREREILDLYRALLARPNQGTMQVFCEQNAIHKPDFNNHLKSHYPNLVRKKGRQPGQKTAANSIQEPSLYNSPIREKRR